MEYEAEGFSFTSERDAKLAEEENAKIQYLEAHMDYSNPESILKVYQKAIQDRVFKTPVGMIYLKGLQNYLLQQGDLVEGQVRAIPVYQIYEQLERERRKRVRNRIQPSTKKEKTGVLAMSVILNLAMGIAIIAMFAITLNSEQPNILNYERAITNRYASWEQQLTEREEAVRAKEIAILTGSDTDVE